MTEHLQSSQSNDRHKTVSLEIGQIYNRSVVLEKLNCLCEVHASSNERCSGVNL